ncbi:hypothetical protein [Klebsiella aerogenes]|uniref:hypothetical protein n=1 Tax=Klebsiella aerogenes TaxID=548 RepID=UPI00351D9B58
MSARNDFFEHVSFHTELKTELTLNHQIDLLIEQVRIERWALEMEVSELRKLLDAHKVCTHAIDSASVRSDKVLDKLLRYELGRSGKYVKRGLHIMPYRWRRKLRKIFQRDD